MSRVGKRPIVVPEGVEVKVSQEDGRVSAQGPGGQMQVSFEPQFVSVEMKDGVIYLGRKGDDKLSKARHGLYRSLIANMIQGVYKPFTKTLILKGLGYKAKLDGGVLTLELGYSHPISYSIPDGIKVSVKDQTEIIVTGPDKQLVGQVAAEIRNFRPPEPYKGKGIRYKDEQIIRKEGKLGGGEKK
jgi:large subunit ribosomal protein L6